MQPDSWDDDPSRQAVEGQRLMDAGAFSLLEIWDPVIYERVGLQDPDHSAIEHPGFSR